jgi:phage baseplate assembly protein W
MPIPGPRKAIRLAAKSLKDGIQSAKKIGTLSDLASFAEGADSLLALKDKAFADIVLESIGASIPLPTQSQVKIFYQDLEGKTRNELPSNPLAYTDPQDWNEAEYIQYQTDYRKYQASQKLKNIKRKPGESLAKAKRRVKKEVDGERKRNYLLTEPGERWDNPTFGGGFRKYLFEQISNDNLGSIQDDISSRISQVFPQVTLNRVEVIGDPVTQIVTAKIYYSIKNQSITDQIEINFG